ncbi:exsB protein [Actinobacillus pleuropneumoniae]|nr:exsB protein [Actinobacillus pleuropneumoniae]
MIKIDNKINSSHDVLVLLSGGIDSASLVHYHLSKGESVSAIFFDYGQVTNKLEYQSARAISNHYDISLEKVKFDFEIRNDEGEFLGRNALFILVAVNFLKGSKSYLSIGIHSGTPYYDSTPVFINNIQSVMDGYSSGTIRVSAPFLNYSKKQVLEYALKEKVPIHLTYSCEVGESGPCGLCLSCLDRGMLDGELSRRS